MEGFSLRKRIFLFLLSFFILFSYFFSKFKEEEVYLSFRKKENSYLFLNPEIKSSPKEVSLYYSDKNFLFSFFPPYFIQPKVFAQILSGETLRNDIFYHIVRQGEDIYSIAKKYGLSPQTIILSNNLSNNKVLPGQELIILPVDGLIHIVSSGEKLEDIAKKYSVSEESILVFNELFSPEEIFENQALIIPGGKLPAPPKLTSSISQFSTNNYHGQSHPYPPGYCTWWVAQKRPVPSLGNAKDWLFNAKAKGFNVCFGSDCEPIVGAIISVKTRHPLGHVAYVERVEGDTVIFSEMNYVGWGKMNFRSLKIGDPRILGYIY
jgi:surface antigen